MHKRTKELIEYGQQCGFVLGELDGHGHYMMSHPNGERVRVAATPGDLRGDRNCEAEMRRKSGMAPVRPNAGRYRKGLGNRRGFNMEHALNEQRPDLSGRYSVGDISVPVVDRQARMLDDMRAQLERARAEYERNPSNLLDLRIRNLEARLELGELDY